MQNQAALYSGVPLMSRDIKSHAKSNRWLWDVLKSERSYVTLKTEVCIPPPHQHSTSPLARYCKRNTRVHEPTVNITRLNHPDLSIEQDGCLKNSNMLQSIGPQTDHGHQLKDFFCHQYVRPHCLGQVLSAQHLLNYTSLFLSEYSGSALPSRLPHGSMSWAAFVHLIDGHVSFPPKHTVSNCLCCQQLIMINPCCQPTGRYYDDVCSAGSAAARLDCQSAFHG